MSNEQSTPKESPITGADGGSPESQSTRAEATPRTELSRRSFLGAVGGATAAATAGVMLPAVTGSKSASAAPLIIDAQTRKEQAYQIRVDAALANLEARTVSHPTNGDEQLYTPRLGNFSKGLPHNQYGEVNQVAYNTMRNALINENAAALENIPSGEAVEANRIKLTNPQAGFAFDLEGKDSHEFTMRAAPAFGSAECAGEIVENYWMALMRDVPFSQFTDTNPDVAPALADLSALHDFRGPKVNGHVTAATLFRLNLPGALIGPYISQFLFKTAPFGAQYVEPRMRCPLITTANNFMTTVPDWLDRQNGKKPTAQIQWDSQLRYIRRPRDLAEWVHIDVLYQAYFQAALILMTPPDAGNLFHGGGLGCPPNVGNPYRTLTKQIGFGTFGGPYFATILTEVATRALKAVWYQKWLVHRRLRPEEMAGKIHFRITEDRNYPIHKDALKAAGPAQVFKETGTYLLPQAYPEGCPTHPAYGAGHATVAGACVTILKALFDETMPYPNPVQPTQQGFALLPLGGPDAGNLTVGGELNKLAMNVAMGRNMAGVHWRTDASESLKLGEQVAISILREQKATYSEAGVSHTFTKFDGTQITI